MYSSRFFATSVLVALAAVACDEPKPAAPAATATVAAVATTAAAAATTAAATASATAAAPKAPVLPAAMYDIDMSHSKVGFSVRHMMVSNTRGQFKTFKGTANIDQSDLSKMAIVLEIDTASIDTSDPKRDAHLNSPEFFDTKKFPKMTFKSTKVEADGDGYKMTGDLTMHDVTKPVVLKIDSLSGEAKDPYGFMRRGAHATATIMRSEFGLKWNAALEAGGVAVSEEVKLDLDVELTRKADAATAGTGSAATTASAAPSTAHTAPAKK
jgi:polyisoprenoid-binding protein YceI